MIDLYKYKDTLTFINISIIFSIPIISFIFYKVFKDNMFLVILGIYTIEIINMCILENISIENNYNIYISCIFKVILSCILVDKYKLKRYLKVSIPILSFIYILTLKMKYQYASILAIVINSIILKESIIDKVKDLVIDLQYNKSRLKQDKEYIRQSEQYMTHEYNLQNNYKDKIFKLNTKISQSIEESDIPVFMLNINKEYIYSNKAFKSIVAKDGIDINNFNILSYLKSKFSQGHQIVDTINKINKETSININSYQGNTYRFICTTDIIDEQNVIICILNDITKTTIIQNKLIESEERYKKLMNVLNEGVIIHDGKTITYANNKAIDLFNLCNIKDCSIEIEYIKNKLVNKFRKEFSNNIDLVKSGDEERTITKLETKEGKVVEFITTNLGLNDKNIFISIAIDITNLENAISDIEQSEKTYKLLLHTLPEGIIIIDKKTNRHIYRNETIIEILKSVGIEKFSEVVNRYLENCKYGEFKEFTINSKNNIDISLAVIDRKEDDTLVVVVRTLDYEYKSIRMKEELRKITKKNKFKADFLYNIVNDIRGPIDNIFEANKKLYQNKENYKLESKHIDNYSKLLKQNCYRLIRLSDNIKTIKEIENGNCKLNLEKCDIISLINSIVNYSKSYTDKKGISIDIYSDIQEKIMIIDVEKIEKIILNILSNAIKFTHKYGKINLYIKEDNNKINISIKDTGIGIPNEKIDDIFDSFEQVDRTLSRGAEGTGMGLYLVKKLCELHDIEVYAYSKEQIGSEFKIVINENIYSEVNDISNELYNIPQNSEKIDVEYSDIYIDIS